MTRYLLDTNIVGYCIKQEPMVLANLVAAPASSLYISVITEAELLFGLAKRPDPRKLHRLVHEFLRRMTVLPWERDTARIYGDIRAELTTQGKTLAPLDLLIAAQALAAKATLVTRD
ncbi:MAG: PIN domain-containing protein [Pseudomonadota bacterium]